MTCCERAAKPAQPNGVFTKEADALDFMRRKCNEARDWAAVEQWLGAPATG